MNQGFEELNKAGIKGIIAFWLRLLLLLLSFAIMIFSIVWMAKASGTVFIKSVGADIVVTNVFLMLISLAAGVFLILCRLNIKLIYSVQFTHHVFALLSFIGQILCCVLMTMSTSTRAEIYLTSLLDYCQRNPTNSDVQKFMLKYPTYASQHVYIAGRSLDLYPSISAFFGIWFASTVIYLICSSSIPQSETTSPLFPTKKAEEANNPLLNNNDENGNNQNENNEANSQAQSPDDNQNQNQQPAPYIESSSTSGEDNEDEGLPNITTKATQPNQANNTNQPAAKEYDYESYEYSAAEEGQA